MSREYKILMRKVKDLCVGLAVQTTKDTQRTHIKQDYSCARKISVNGAFYEDRAAR